MVQDSLRRFLSCEDGARRSLVSCVSIGSRFLKF